MNLKKLLSLYPEGIITKKEPLNSNDFYVSDGSDYFVIDPRHITEREQHLLNEFFPKKKSFQSEWYDFLLNEIPLSNPPSSVRMIHFYSEYKEDPYLWLDTFKTFFSHVIDAFYFDDMHGIIIIDDIPIDRDELDGFLKTLTDDFSSYASLYIGNCYRDFDQIPLLFNEEFHLAKRNAKHRRIADFQSLYLQTFVKEGLGHSHIAYYLKQRIATSEEFKELISVMWHHQGNVSASAATMYIHRNTLNYRLDKYQELTGLSLRNLDDLIFSYLLTL